MKAQMKGISLMIILLMLVLTVQAAALRGTVTDEATKEPLIGAAVHILQEKLPLTVFVLKLMLNITKKVVNRQNVIIIQTVTQNHTVTAIITTQRKNITVLLLQTPVRIRQLLNQEVKQQLRLKAIQILKVLQKKRITNQL